MVQWEEVRHQVTISGWVSDGQTGAPVAGGKVLITSGPTAFTNWLAVKASIAGSAWDQLSDRPDTTLTARDGHFYFMDLPDGSYAITVSAPTFGSRYGTAQATVAVARDGSGNITLAPLALSLPPTTVTGRVTDSSSNGLSLAEVRVQGSGERTHTDAQGNYVLVGIEKGARKLQANATGFQASVQTVTIAQAGDAVTLDFSLTSSPSPPGP